MSQQLHHPITRRIQEWDGVRRLAVVRMASRPVHPLLKTATAAIIQALAVEEANRVVPLSFADMEAVGYLMQTGNLAELPGDWAYEEVAEEGG